LYHRIGGGEVLFSLPLLALLICCKSGKVHF